MRGIPYDEATYLKALERRDPLLTSPPWARRLIVLGSLIDPLADNLNFRA